MNKAINTLWTIAIIIGGAYIVQGIQQVCGVSIDGPFVGVVAWQASLCLYGIMIWSRKLK